jgi:hypothetical protein
MIRRKLPKKEREMILLKDFISNESLGLRVKGIEESETPDFIVHEIEKNISIELTQLIHPNLIEKEVFREKLVNMAHKIFKEKYNIELYVLITFNNVPIRCKGNEIKKVAESLFGMIESIYLRNKEYEFNISTKKFDSNDKYIDRISVSNTQNLENWQSFGAFKVDEINIDWVKAKIIEKEKMIERYRGNFDERWLLLVSNFGFKSDTHGFYYLKQEKIESKFDKIYLYAYRDKEIINLK